MQGGAGGGTKNPDKARLGVGTRDRLHKVLVGSVIRSHVCCLTLGVGVFIICDIGIRGMQKQSPGPGVGG